MSLQHGNLQADTDGSGVIDYTEFLAATLDKKVYVQEPFQHGVGSTLAVCLGEYRKGPGKAKLLLHLLFVGEVGQGFHDFHY